MKNLHNRLRERKNVHFLRYVVASDIFQVLSVPDNLSETVIKLQAS